MISATVSTFPLSICHEVMGLDAMILSFLNVAFQASFFTLSFTLIKRLFSSSLLSAIRMVSSALSVVVDISYSNLDSSL